MHGRFDYDRDIVYLNGKSETSLDWAFWHEAFHVMKKHEPELFEMLADAFADMKTGRRVMEEISKGNRSLADKLAAFAQKLLDGVKNFFKAKGVQEKYP